MVDRILVPTDFAPASRAALRYACAIARTFGARIHLLHVCQVPALASSEIMVRVSDQAASTLAEYLEDEARRRLVALSEETSRELGDDPPPLDSERRFGYASDVVVDVARAGQHGLIIMGTHGHRGVARWVRGSVAEKVVRHAPCPVITLHDSDVPPQFAGDDQQNRARSKSDCARGFASRDAERRHTVDTSNAATHAKVSRILVPVDISDHSRNALVYARRFAARIGATIDVLHVYEAPHYAGDIYVQRPGEPGVPLQEWARANAEQEMHRFIDGFPPVDGESPPAEQHRLAQGTPVETILRIAENEGYDLLVLGTQGRTGLSHFLLGSVAEKVVRHSPCPVLTVHADHGAP